MDRDQALLELATPHAVALRLATAGAAHEVIGAALGIPVEAVAPLLGVAGRKLAALMGDSEDCDEVDLRDGAQRNAVDNMGLPPPARQR